MRVVRVRPSADTSGAPHVRQEAVVVQLQLVVQLQQLLLQAADGTHHVALGLRQVHVEFILELFVLILIFLVHQTEITEGRERWGNVRGSGNDEVDVDDDRDHDML